MISKWSKLPKRYKRNAINGELYRSKRIATNFKEEETRIRRKYQTAGYPIRFVNSVINDFNSIPVPDDVIIPTWLFEERRTMVIYLPYSPENEEYSKRLLEKLNSFSQQKCIIKISWKTKTIRSLFTLKDKVTHISNVIYHGICSCNADYYGETDRNSTIRWNEHNNPLHNSNAAKHLKDNLTHKFKWSITRRASSNIDRRKILEAFYIRKFNPSLNSQQEIKTLILFRNGIT